MIGLREGIGFRSSPCCWRFRLPPGQKPRTAEKTARSRCKPAESTSHRRLWVSFVSLRTGGALMPALVFANH